MQITIGKLKRVIREEIASDNVFIQSSLVEKLREAHTALRMINIGLRSARSSADVGDDEAGAYTETSREGVSEARQSLMSAVGACGDALSSLEI